MHRGIAQCAAAAQQATSVHGKTHPIHGAVLDQVTVTRNCTVIEVVVGPIDFQGADTTEVQIPHNGTGIAGGTKGKARTIVKNGRASKGMVASPDDVRANQTEVPPPPTHPSVLSSAFR